MAHLSTPQGVDVVASHRRVPIEGQLIIFGKLVAPMGAADRYLGMLESLSGDFEAANRR